MSVAKKVGEWTGPAHRTGGDEYETLDEAIRAALDELDPGGTLTIHDEHCTSPDGETGCSCVPMVITKQGPGTC